jgi:1-acyl-sn-glycerol-3-phosphate acyltransferase
MAVGVTTVFFASVVLIEYLLTFWIKDKSYLHQVGVAWARSIVAMNRSWKISIHGSHNIPPPGTAAIYVSNHVSQTDILAIYSTGADFRWLSKDSVFRIPFLGWAMRAIGYVPVARGNKESHKQAMETSKQHLLSGTPMFFFPEGTRSPDGRIRKFKLGAFQLAYETRVPVIPIILIGTEQLLPKGSITPGDAAISISIQAPIQIDEQDDIQSIADKVFTQMNSQLPPHMKALK